MGEPPFEETPSYDSLEADMAIVPGYQLETMTLVLLPVFTTTINQVLLGFIISLITTCEWERTLIGNCLFQGVNGPATLLQTDGRYM